MLRPVPDEERRCPLGECDGSTWIFDEDRGEARPCRCRERRMREAVSGGLGTGIGRRFLEVSFEREPIVSLDPVVLRQVRAFVRSIDDQLEAGRGLWFDGPVGTGKTLAGGPGRQGGQGGRALLRRLPRPASAGRDQADLRP